MNLRILRLALAFCAISCCFAQGYENPVVRGMNPDPPVVRVGSDYYLVTSSMSFYPGCPIYHSLDLIHWQRIGYALTSAAQFSLQKNHGKPNIYAATLRYHDGTFYVGSPHQTSKIVR